MIEEKDLENNILYELLIYAEWMQEPEVQGKASTAQVEIKDPGYWSRWLSFISWSSCPSILVQKLNNLQMPWSFAIGGNGAVIAVLQDTVLEIRTSRDEYGAIIGRTQVSRDPCPQWRRILWSPDCTMLACAHSSGKLDFYDLIGAHMFTIHTNSSENPRTIVAQLLRNEKPDFRYAIAGMAFSDVRVKKTQWSYEFLTANYDGMLQAYYISPSDGFQLNHTFNFRNHHSDGISYLAYLPTDNLLLVSGHITSSSKNDASRMGLSCWRLLNDMPHYKLAHHFEGQTKNTWQNMLSKYSLLQNNNQDLIFKMNVSPNGKILSAIHTSGALTLWDLPSLKLRKIWPLDTQPNFADMNPQSCDPGLKKRSDRLTLDPLRFFIIDINWWSDEALIVVRRNGAVTVSSIKSLQNLLGVSPEWFEPSPAVTSFCDRGFLTIESEIRVKAKRRSEDDDDYSSDEEEPSIFAHTYNLAQKVLFFITDSDRFQPPRKKMKMINKTYRLMCLKSTTPEELYTRKIDNEEYGEALALAKTYALDTDLVYQRQWRRIPATVESIHDYLSKIKKRSWVLHECIERVPDSFEATKELLLYGLQGTDLKALIAIGKGVDQRRFILPGSYDDDDDDDDPDFDTSLSYGSELESILEAKNVYQQKKRTELLKQVNFKKLTLEQKQLCQCRLKLLKYLDRLTTYELILGGPIASDEHFDSYFFKRFRSQSGLEAALHFACNSNWEAVASLFTYHGGETLPHRMAVLSFLPETTAPVEYQSILPLYNDRESLFYPWDEHQLREKDWCELKYKMNPPPEDDFIEDFYEKNKNFNKYRKSSLTLSLATEWFMERAKEVELRSGLVDNALQLLSLGIQRKIQGLEKLYDEMTSLQVLVYECSIKEDLNLKYYEALTDFEKVELIMSTASQDTFIKNISQWLLPFLKRCAKYDADLDKTLFKSYLLSISKDGLSYIKRILESFKSDNSLILWNFDETVCTILDCIYNCERTDDLKNANAIYELLLGLPDIFSRITRKQFSLPNSVATLKKHISAAELLAMNDLSVPLSSVRNIAENSDDVKKLFIKLTRMASHRSPVLGESDWTSLLADVLDMQRLLFQCVSYEDCYEIVLHSLLCSGRSSNITFAGRMMDCGQRRKDPPSFRLPYARAVQLVLTAAREYYNSSANSDDPCMSFAKESLKLIQNPPESIEEEMDLISSISLLQEFGLSILPLQVRLSENKMMIVQDALYKKDKNYKKSFKIMKLAHLLRAGNCSPNEREGKVWTLIAERAFKVGDYEESLRACQHIMDSGYKEGWMICFTLGECAEFENVTARSALMSFALAYCSEDLIETVLTKKSELQLQVLQDRVKFLLGDIPFSVPINSRETEVNDVVGSHSIWHTGERTLHALQTTTQTAKVVLTSSVQFWKDAINWIQPASYSNADEDSNAQMDRQGVCAFYHRLGEESHISKFEANYQRFARPDLERSVEISSSILRAAFLQDAISSECDRTAVEDSVLLDIAKIHLPEDTSYCLYVLSALSQATKAETLFSQLPSCPVILELACLFYALKIHASSSGFTSTDLLGEANPTEFYTKVAELSISNECTNLLHKYRKILYDFVQAQLLHSIGGGVDATRFANDDVYKKDTILGIAMTIDDGVFQTAISLAQHYNVPLWDLYMTHLEYLFSETNVPASTLKTRLEHLALFEKLRQQKKAFEARLRDGVWASLGGNDHDKLLLCLDLLENCGDNRDSLGVKPSVHKKLLAKFRAALKNVDYKKIMSTESSQSYMSRVLNESNVHVFAKAAAEIPFKNGDFYQSSKIYCLWTEKYFFEGNSSNTKEPSTKTEWMHRYESCTDMLNRLDPTDVLALVDSVIFAEKSLQKMDIDTRGEIAKRFVKFCRSKSTKYKNSIVLSTEWSQTATNLNALHSHLQRLEDETLDELRNSMDPKIKNYCQEFDLSKSATEKLRSLLSRIVVEGPDIELLKTFIACCPSDVDWEPADAYLSAVTLILAQLKQPLSSSYFCPEDRSPIQCLEAILQDISEQQEELMMIEDQVPDLLHRYCQDPEVPVSIRLSVLQLLEKTNCISPEFCDLLLLYRTQTVVSSLWPDLQVSEEEVQDEVQRSVLLDSLLANCHTSQQLQGIAKVLSQWPPFSSNHSMCEPWTRVLSSLVSIDEPEALAAAVTISEKALTYPTFTKENFEDVFKQLKAKGRLLYILKFALQSDYKFAHEEAIEAITASPVVTLDDYDSEVLDLLLKRHLIAKIVSTDLYRPVIEFLLRCQDDSMQQDYRTLDCVVQDLYDSGYEHEAGSLLLIKNNTHTGLSTFSAALAVLKQWLSTTS